MEEAVLARRRKFITNCAYYACIAAIIFLIFRYAIYTVMPFLIAFVVAVLLKPVVGFLERKLRLRRSVGAFVMTILFYGTVGLLLTLLGIRIVVYIRELVLSLPDIYTARVLPTLDRMFNGVEEALNDMSPEVVSAVERIGENITKSLGTFISETSNSLVSSVTKYATGIPGLLINAIITVISTFFMTLDYALITGFVTAQLPEKAKKLTEEVRASLGRTLGQYIKSYLLIMLITFLEIFIGLSIIGSANALVLAVLIAVFDILPVIGSGMILFPWTVITLAQGDVERGIGLGVLWLVVVVVRQIMEPKIVGDQVGLHPIITLVSMIVGAALFGGVGLLGLPVMVAIIKRLHDQGTIGLYRDFSPPEPEPRKKRRRRGDKDAPPDAPCGADDAAGQEPEAGERGDNVKFE